MPVYEYKGQHYELPEGLSNEQVLAKIKGYLGETTEAAKPTESPSIGSELGRQLGLTARAGISGLSAVPNAVADFLSGAANLGLQATGSEKRVPYLSQIQQQALEQTFPTPRPGLEQNVQTAAEAVAGMLTPGIKTPMAQQTESQTAKEIGRRAATEAAAVATGAVVGEEAAKKTTEITGSPWAGLAAGLATGTIAGSATGKGLFTLTGPRAEPVSIEQVRNRASQGYKAMDEAGISVKTSSIKNNLLPSIESELKANNYDPTVVKAHGDIADTLNLLKKVSSDPYIDFNRLEKIRGSFSALSKGDSDTARLAKIVTNQIDSYLGSLKNSDTISLTGADPKKAIDALQQARTDWRNQARAQVLQDMLDAAQIKAEGTTTPKSNLIQNAVVNLAANKDKMALFSTREQNVIKAAAKADDIEKMLSYLAKFNPQRNVFQQSVMTGGVAGITTTPGQLIAGTGAVGYGSDKLLGALRERELKNVISQIASGKLQPPKEGFAVPGLFGATMGTTGQ